MATSVRTRLSRRLSSWSVRLDPAPVGPADPGPAEAVPVLDIETVRLVHKEIKDRLARLDANSARLDTKATSLLGFVSAISLFLATQKIDGWLKLIAYCGLAAAGYLGFQAMRVRRYTEAPEPRLLAQQVGKQEAAVLALLTEAQIRTYEKNQKMHEQKASLWRWSLGFLALAVGLTIIALVFGGNHARAGQPRPASSSPAVTTTAPAGTIR